MSTTNKIQARKSHTMESFDKETTHNKKSVQSASQLASYKLRAEKSYLQKRQEAMKRWMDKHRDESARTIIKVCNTAKAVVERMAKEKEKQMHEIIEEMEKAHQDELCQTRIEAKKEAFQELIRKHAMDKLKDTKSVAQRSPTNIYSSLHKALKASLEDTASKMGAFDIQQSEESAMAGLRQDKQYKNRPQIITHEEKQKRKVTFSDKPEKIELSFSSKLPSKKPSDCPAKKARLEEIEERNSMPKARQSPSMCIDELQACKVLMQMASHEASPSKSQSIVYMDEKQPFCEVEMCAIRSLNQPKTKQVIVELESKPRHEVQSNMQKKRQKTDHKMKGKSSNKSEIEELAHTIQIFTCNACGRNGSDMLMCGGCFGNFYCDEKCQSRDWDLHTKWCTEDD